jgi:glutamate-ammonia-ligase adenylyltransferase
MLLREAGFPDVNTSYNVLKDLLVPDDKKIAMEKGVHLLEKAMPFFLEEILNLPEPGPALIALDSYIDSLYAHSTYFSTLLENPPTLKFIIKILGESRFFTDLLIRHPQSIDSLIAKGAEAFPKSRDSLSANLTERLTYSDGLEEQLDVLRRFKNEEMLLIGVHHLAGEIESTTARKLITDLAEACLEGAVDIAAAEMAKKFGMIDSHENPPLVILGMGKLGGREMTYLSDLDVIFIYDSTVETIGKLTAHEWFSRFAGRIISVLNIPTSEGTAWAIDTRLRPSGNKGPLVSSIKSFQDYHSTSAQLWEKQALTRARPVSGPMTTCTVISEAIRNSILNLEFSEASLAEIAKLRSRMEAEIAQENRDYVDLKTGKGGLVDIEFCVQALILKHAKAHPEVLVQNTLEALRMLNDQNLLDQGHYDVLSAGYLFLINLEDKLRLMENRSIDRIPLHGDKLRGLAGRLGYLEESEFTRDYRRITESIRRVYNFIFYPSDNLNYSNEGDSALN